MFTALVVTRLIFDFLLQKNWLKGLPMLHLIRGSNLDFMKIAKIAFVASWILILAGNGFGAYRLLVKKDILGVDFAGGDTHPAVDGRRGEGDDAVDVGCGGGARPVPGHAGGGPAAP